MKAKELFTIILKIFGIYLIKDVLLAIPPVLGQVVQFFEVSRDIGFFSFVFSLLNLGLHLLIAYLLLFKPNWLISKLKLTADLSEEPLKFNMHRSSIYTIAIIVTGLLILVFAIPTLVKQIYYWYGYMDARKRMFGPQSYNYSGLLIAITEVIIGLLFLGNQRTLVNFIESRKRQAKVDQPPNASE